MIRFHAEILTTGGRNPFVDVPPGVSEALADHAVAGRVRVEGRLNDVDFQWTRVPTRRGGHRLYVPGGLRSAAPATVGDTVVVDIEGRMPDNVRPPTDLAKALAATPNGKWTVEDFLRGRPPEIRALFDAVHSLVAGSRDAGAYRDRIALMERVRFAGVRPRLRWLDGEFWLPGPGGVCAAAEGRDAQSLRPYPQATHFCDRGR